MELLDKLRALEEGPVEEGGRPRLGKYEIVERIGGGGFGSVYRAYDPSLQREVAVKTCETTRPGRRERFFREATLAARLQHPNIVTIFDFDGDAEVPFIVQEFLKGEDLHRMIARGEPATLEGKVRVLDQAARGLEHAHAEGVVHRDIKPSNLWRTPEGAVKILDFGIAKSLDDEDGPSGRPEMALGSAGYMSPEQIEGRPLDHRTDLFSLGIVAYELFGGRPPFDAPTVPQLFERIVHEDPVPLSEVCAEVPAPIDALVLRALSKDPDGRPANAREFRKALSGLDAGRAPVRAG